MITLQIVNGEKVLGETSGEGKVHLVYQPAYRKGDAVCVLPDKAGFYMVRLEDTMLPALVYLTGKASFPIPFGVQAAGYSPRSFKGKRHFISVREAAEEEVLAPRDLAFNPYDTENSKNMFPHISSNVRYPDSFRNRIFPDIGLFAARNVIDGIVANESHRLYPHQSWGINRMKDARLHLDFGMAVVTESVSLILRCEFPHDSYWTQVTMDLLDAAGGILKTETLTLSKTMEPQVFAIPFSGVYALALRDLIKANEPSEFPALSQLEVHGRIMVGENHESI